MERWQRALSESITSLEELAHFLNIDGESIQPVIDRYPLRTQIDRQRMRQPDHAGFCHHVRRVPWRCPQPLSGRDVDDPGRVGFPQEGQGRPDQELLRSQQTA